MNELKTIDELEKDKTGEQELFAFPELVFKEFLAILAAMIVLGLWSLLMDAPLKEVADPNWTENPAKAPWYFVGLQEVLVYFDPWIAGVCLPLLIILGLAALPYMDPNPQGVGKYGFRGRRLAISVFLSGYIFWFALILIGQFLRGPSWHFYWPWEDWSIVKAAEPALTNLPNPLGLALIAGYLGLGIAVTARTARRRRLGRSAQIKFICAWILILLMFGVMGKMALRIFLHIKYIVSTPYFSI